MATPHKDQPILIAGGGIGGLSAALALARRGRAVQVLEREAGFAEVGAGIQLAPNVFKMFERLGLTDAILDTAVLPKALVMLDGLTGETITRIPVNSNDFQNRFRYPYAVTYRPDLHSVLLEACRAEPLIELHNAARVEGFEDTGSSVRVLVSDGGEFAGAALIGADGVWSRIREKLVGDGKPRVSGHIAYRAVLPTSAVPEHLRLQAAVLWAGPKTHLVHYPLHRGEIFNLVAVFHSDRYEEGWDVFGDPEELGLRFRGQHRDVLAMLERIASWRMWVLCDREPVKTWSSGRVALLGDAAHPTLQYLAQGACMAIEDAVCLASKVEAHRNDHAAAFLAFQNARYLRTARVQLTARFYGDLYHAAGVTAELRALMLKDRSADQAYDGVQWLYAGIDADGCQQL
jgi:3-hydroxybenzoate 6-monooxygenase